MATNLGDDQISFNGDGDDDRGGNCFYLFSKNVPE